MAMVLVNRFKQLLVSVPKGSFYSSDGQVLPHRDSPYELRISTGAANREYAVFCNEIFKGLVVTNGSGIALVIILLNLGRNDIRLVDTITQTETLAFITTRDYATWFAAEAQTMEGIDEGVEQVLLDARLATASASLIEDTFGRTVQTGNSFGYDLETYREILTELRTAYRSFGATYDGISRAVRAFTTINPLIYPRSFGPRWLLGEDFLYPETDTSNTTLYSTSPLTNIDHGAGISITHFASRNGIGTGTIKAYGLSPTKKLSWTPPGGIEGTQVTISTAGTYTLYGGNYFDLIVGVPGPFNIIAGRNDKLALNIDDKGVIVITLTAGGARTATQIAADINTALTADLRYGGSYATFAASYDPFASGGPMVRLLTPNGATDGSVAIHLNGLVDAAQTIFDLPDVRGGLSAGYLAGVTTLVLSGASVMSTWPLASVEEPINVIIGNTTFHPIGAPNAPAAPANTELIKVTNVDRATRTLTLAAPGLAYAHNANEIVYLENITPYKRTNVVNAREVTVTVGNPLGFVFGNPSDAIVIQGSGLPDGWVVTTNAGGAPTLQGFQPHTHFELDRDLPFGLSTDHMLQIPAPDALLKYKGWTVYLAFLARVDDPSRAVTQAALDTIEISYDDRATWNPGVFAASYIGLDVNATWRPREFRRIFYIDPSATKIWFRLKALAGTTGYTTIHKVRLITLPGFGSSLGLMLGDGTIPRGESQIKQGSFMYVWSPKALTTLEKEALGVNASTQINPGHIDKLAPDFAWLDKFDVSAYDGSGNPINIKGTFDETEFLAGDQTNLGLVLRSPSRFTYLAPERASETTQILSLPSSGPYMATLDITSDQDQSKAVLLEGGVPVKRDGWQFNSSTQVELLSTPLAGAIYEFHYNALIRFETADIDLGVIYSDYLWFADFDVFTRPEIEPTILSITTGIEFDGNGVATLLEKADQNQAQATLIEDTGVVRRIVPTSQWSFLDGRHINISTSIFEPAALYELTYMAEVNHPSTKVGVQVEIKSADTQVNLGAATYKTIGQNTVVGTSLQWHKMRVTLTNIRDIRDAKVFSLLLKGLNLIGLGGTIPILRQ